MKKRVAVFSDSSNFILKGVPEDALTALKQRATVVEDPDLSKVAGIPPHHWSLVDGVILPMSLEERNKLNIENFGAPFYVGEPPIKPAKFDLNCAGHDLMECKFKSCEVEPIHDRLGFGYVFGFLSGVIVMVVLHYVRGI